MEIPFNEKKCVNHPELNSAFYCFDDNSFLCSKCFKNHKKHNIEIIDDLKEKDKIYKSLIASKISISDFYLKMKTVLEKVKISIQQNLLIINNKLEEMKNSAPPGEIKTIFNLSYKEYEYLNNILELLSKIHAMSMNLISLNKTLKKQNEYINFRSINKEVNIIEKSKEYHEFPVEIMFDKDSSQEYTLFQGANDHFIILDFGKKYYLKNIQIIIANHDCTLKDFKVQIKNKDNVWEDAGKFTCAPYTENQGLQEFNIGKEAQLIRLDFINNWGIKSGNYILIKRMFFCIADIV